MRACRHRVQIIRPGVIASTADFQSDDDVGMLLGHAQRRRSVDHPNVNQLARFGDQPDARDVEEGEDARAGAIDDQSAETVERVGAGRACVDGGRHPSSDAIRIEIEAPVRQPRESVHVQIDQAGGDNLSADPYRACGLTWIDLRRDGCHLATGDGQVGDAIQRLRGVDDPPPLQEQLILALGRLRQRRGQGAKQQGSGPSAKT